MNSIETIAAPESPPSSHKVPPATTDLAASVAAVQCLNGRVRTLDQFRRDAFFSLKSRATQALCDAGYCVGHGRVSRDSVGEDLWTFDFQIGERSYGWALPVRMVTFSPTRKLPPTPYAGPAIDTLNVARMGDDELLRIASEAFAPKYKESSAVEEAPKAVGDEQQIVWLEEFLAANGRWPMRRDEHPEGNQIGQRTHIWRARFKKGVLDQTLVQTLNKLRFPWDGHSEKWFPEFFELCGHLESTGRWPAKGQGADDTEQRLADWVALQTRIYRYGTLAPRKKWLLDALNIDWGGYSEKQGRYERLNAKGDE